MESKWWGDGPWESHFLPESRKTLICPFVWKPSAHAHCGQCLSYWKVFVTVTVRAKGTHGTQGSPQGTTFLGRWLWNYGKEETADEEGHWDTLSEGKAWTGSHCSWNSPRRGSGRKWETSQSEGFRLYTKHSLQVDNTTRLLKFWYNDISFIVCFNGNVTLVSGVWHLDLLSAYAAEWSPSTWLTSAITLSDQLFFLLWQECLRPLAATFQCAIQYYSYFLKIKNNPVG